MADPKQLGRQDNAKNDSMEWDLIYSYTADQAVKDGILFDVTETAKEIFKVGCDIPWKYRISINVKHACEKRQDRIQDYQGSLCYVLNDVRYALKKAEHGSNLVEFTSNIGGKKFKLWATLDTTSGPAIHIITPEEY